MKTAQEIRLENLRKLLAEAGNGANLKRLTGVAQPFISQLLKGTPLESGKPRALGDETARKLEKGMGKPQGWMDKDHSMAMLFSELNGLEGQLVTLFRQLDDNGRNELLQFANKLVVKLHPQRSAANPYPEHIKTE